MMSKFKQFSDPIPSECLGPSQNFRVTCRWTTAAGIQRQVCWFMHSHQHSHPVWVVATVVLRLRRLQDPIYITRTGIPVVAIMSSHLTLCGFWLYCSPFHTREDTRER